MSGRRHKSSSEKREDSLHRYIKNNEVDERTKWAHIEKWRQAAIAQVLHSRETKKEEERAEELKRREIEQAKRTKSRSHSHRHHSHSTKRDKNREKSRREKESKIHIPVDASARVKEKVISILQSSQAQQEDERTKESQLTQPVHEFEVGDMKLSSKLVEGDSNYETVVDKLSRYEKLSKNKEDFNVRKKESEVSNSLQTTPSILSSSKGNNTFEELSVGGTKLPQRPSTTQNQTFRNRLLAPKREVLKVMNLPLSLTLRDIQSLFTEASLLKFLMNPLLYSNGQPELNQTVIAEFPTKIESDRFIMNYQGLKVHGSTVKIIKLKGSLI